MSAGENQIVVYQPNETVRLDVRLENETVWLTQAQLCDLFGVVKSNVSYHLKNIFGTNELDYGATVQKIRTVRTEAKFIRRAKKELIVIDAYPGVATLDMLAKRGRGVKIELVTHSNGELAESDFEAFGAQCGKFTKTICGICHDRFIIVDQKEIFWTGASLKDAGRLTFAAAKMGAEIIPGLLESIHKATVERREYGKGKKAVRMSGAKVGV